MGHNKISVKKKLKDIKENREYYIRDLNGKLVPYNKIIQSNPRKYWYLKNGT